MNGISGVRNERHLQSVINLIVYERQFCCTVEPRFNEPLCNEVLGITNDIFQPSNSVMYGKEPRYNEPQWRSQGRVPGVPEPPLRDIAIAKSREKILLEPPFNSARLEK